MKRCIDCKHSDVHTVGTVKFYPLYGHVTEHENQFICTNQDMFSESSRIAIRNLLYVTTGKARGRWGQLINGYCGPKGRFWAAKDC